MRNDVKQFILSSAGLKEIDDTVEKIVRKRTEDHIKKVTGYTVSQLERLGIDADIDYRYEDKVKRGIMKQLGLSGVDSIKEKIEKLIAKYDLYKALGKEPELEKFMEKVESISSEVISKIKCLKNVV
jgi:hypothetical protein